jgi:hypothetical protein
VSDPSFVAGEPPVHPPPTGSKRWFVWLFASEGLNYLSYLALAPVIVSYAVFALGTLGFVVVSGMEANRSLVEAMLAPLLRLDAQYPWISWVYNDDQTFRANALRVFGMISVVGYLGRTIWTRARGRAAGPLPFGVRLRRAAGRLGVFTAVLVVAMAGAVMTAPWTEGPPLWQIVLQSVGISALMGGLLFAASLPALALSHGLREARRFVGRWMSR